MFSNPNKLAIGKRGAGPDQRGEVANGDWVVLGLEEDVI
jgi:hypothetical protein